MLSSVRMEENKEQTAAPKRSRAALLKRGAWFFLLASVAAGLISLNYFRLLSIDFSGEGRVYALLTMFGHFAMWGAAGWLVFCAPWALAFPRRPAVVGTPIHQAPGTP